MHENRGDEQARAKVVIFFSMFDAERDNHENETDQRAGRAPGERVETIPVVHFLLPSGIPSHQL
jgi:hypothetical protein